MAQLIDQKFSVDLFSILKAIWRNGWIVILSVVFFANLSMFYSRNGITPEYVASTRFLLSENQPVNSPVNELGALASFAGLDISGQSSEADKLSDRILSRPFVASIFDDLEFQSDPVFNRYIATPTLVERIAGVFLGSPVRAEPTEIEVLVSVVGNLARKLKIEIQENGIIQLNLAHSDPQRASLIANAIATRVLEDILNRKRIETRDSLNYFADELLKIRSDLDNANAAVQNYAVENNVRSAEILVRVSSQLSQLREGILASENSLEAIDVLDALPGGRFNALSFSQAHPISLSIEFRRLFSWPQSLEGWIFPSPQALDDAKKIVQARNKNLKTDLAQLEIVARNSGNDALELARLEREVEVQAAIYESVITRFEAQSLASNFERASGEVIETAIPPSSPLKPNVLLMLIMGVIAGFLVGVLLALVYSVWKGEIFGLDAIRRSFGAEDAKILSKRKLPDLGKRHLGRDMKIAMLEMATSICESDSKIVFWSADKSDFASRLALGVAKAENSLGSKVAIVDLSGNAAQDVVENSAEPKLTGFKQAPVAEGVSLYFPNKTDWTLSRGSVEMLATKLPRDFEKVFFVCPAPQMGTATAAMISKISNLAIVVVKGSRARQKTSRQISSVLDRVMQRDPRLVVVN